MKDRTCTARSFRIWGLKSFEPPWKENLLDASLEFSAVNLNFGLNLFSIKCMASLSVDCTVETYLPTASISYDLNRLVSPMYMQKYNIYIYTYSYIYIYIFTYIYTYSYNYIIFTYIYIVTSYININIYIYIFTHIYIYQTTWTTLTSGRRWFPDMPR